MNAPTQLTDVTTEFHLARSRCIDSFARAESAVAALLRAQGMAVNGEPFSQKLGTLAKLEPSPTNSKAWKAAVDAAGQQLAELLPVRADIVHAPLTLVTLQGVRRACFFNPRDGQKYGQCARVFSTEDFKNLVKRVDAIVRKMAKPVNPASSPRPPSPGAEGAP